MKKTALITGATGFTGTNLCRWLADRGWGVRALVRKGRPVEDLAAIGAVAFEGDLLNPGSLARAAQGATHVFHLAAAWQDASLADRTYFEVNVDGTRNLIEAAAGAGVERFVHCSTIGVHGDTGRTPADERAPFAPPDVYCESKAEGERVARESFDRLGVRGTVFRPLGIYGPRDRRFLKLFKSVARGRFFMIGDGKTLYHMTYIDDLCEGIRLCGVHPEAVGEVFILGGPGHTTLAQLVSDVAAATGGRTRPVSIPLGPVMAAAHVCEAICRPLGIRPPLHPRRVEFFSKHRAADISKARRLLGYDPKVDFPEGARRTADWYRRQGWL